jgi:phosphoglycerate kinase
MAMGLRSFQNAAVTGKHVLVRVDFNVPLSKDEHGEPVVADDTRIRAALPTLIHLIEAGAHVVLASHLGRPKGVDPSLSLAPVAVRLEELLNEHLAPLLSLASKHTHADSVLRPLGLTSLAEHGVERLRVLLLPDCVGSEVESSIASLRPGELALLENLRFHPEEEANDPEFCKQLAALADIYVSDAFGTVHRAHASTEGVAHLLPSYAGLLLEREASALSAVVTKPSRPLVIVMGGAKISGKLEVLQNLIPLADRVLIGGAMANTFLKAQGFSVGASMVEDDMLEVAEALLTEADKAGKVLLLPLDLVVTDSLAKPEQIETRQAVSLEPGDIAADIGPVSLAQYTDALSDAGTVFWNGPMGVFENPHFSSGTLGIAHAMAGLHGKAFTVIGGGESVEAANQAGVAQLISHISTGGGASLEFVAGRELPGLSVLKD